MEPAAAGAVVGFAGEPLGEVEPSAEPAAEGDATAPADGAAPVGSVEGEGVGDEDEGRFASVVQRMAMAVTMPATAVINPGRLDQKLGFFCSVIGNVLVGFVHPARRTSRCARPHYAAWMAAPFRGRGGSGSRVAPDGIPGGQPQFGFRDESAWPNAQTAGWSRVDARSSRNVNWELVIPARASRLRCRLVREGHQEGRASHEAHDLGER